LLAKADWQALKNYLGTSQLGNPFSSEPQLSQHLIRMLPQRRANMPGLWQPA
jgi:hypothetical protein